MATYNNVIPFHENLPNLDKNLINFVEFRPRTQEF